MTQQINQTIQEKIKNSFEVVKTALGDCSQQVAYQLRLHGKRCTPRWVAAQGEMQIVARANFYENFLRWLAALFFANYAGFELLMAEFEIFVSLLRQTRNASVMVFPAAQMDETALTSLIKITREVGSLRARFGLNEVYS